MKLFDYRKVDITSGYVADKQEMNRKITINSVYDRFCDTGRIGAFDFNTKDVHCFWDSDVAKWMEGASYIIAKHPDPVLEERIEALIDRIERHQDKNGYFNIYFTVKEPEKRFTDRGAHELYCAGHLFEAAVAYAEATGKTRFLKCMEKYADYIYKVFVTDGSAAFVTPGHEEIELALFKLYSYTKKEKYLELAEFFLEKRGNNDKDANTDYNQSHRPIREQTEAVGHSVRAVYLYSAMADLARITGDDTLKKACRTIYEDIVNKKMYITGGIGSCHLGETFSKPYDLPNEQAYTETCAGIGLMFFCRRMMQLDNLAEYSDVIERIFYNGVLSGISLDGKSFFYENPLEITHLNHFTNSYGSRRYPITQRLECFNCSCCPPNINRLLPVLEEYIYGIDGDTLYVNQFTSSKLCDGGISCEMSTDYPLSGGITIRAVGVGKIAVRIPSWCAGFEIDAPYTLDKGYAVIESGTDGGKEIRINFDMTPFAVRSNSKVVEDAGKLCIQAGPVVYCAESIDNSENLYEYILTADFESKVKFNTLYGLNELEISAWRIDDGNNGNKSESLYFRADSAKKPATEHTALRMIQNNCFANRADCDMKTWFNAFLN